MRQLVDALTAGEEKRPPSRVGPHEQVDGDEVSGTALPKNAWTASPSRIQEPSGDDIAVPTSPRTTSWSLDAI